MRVKRPASLSIRRRSSRPEQLKECNSRVADRTRGSSNAGISFHLTQFIAINARFVAAVTGDSDRWPLCICGRTQGFPSHDPEAAGQPRRPFGRGGDFCVWFDHQRLCAGRRSSALQDGRAQDGHRARRFRTRRHRRSGDLVGRLLAPGHRSRPVQHRSTSRRAPFAPSFSAPASGRTRSPTATSRSAASSRRDREGKPVGPQMLTVSRRSSCGPMT